MVDAPPVVGKIPGQIPKFENEKDGYVNLASASRTQLLDLLQREEKILLSKKFLSTLPDKGEKIRKFHSCIEEELRKREQQQDLCAALSNLNVTDCKKALDRLEWTGQLNKIVADPVRDEKNPLKILATHSSTNASKQTIDKIGITAETRSSQNETNFSNIEKYASELVNRLDSQRETSCSTKFYTHRLSSEMTKKESTKTAKMLSLQESIDVLQTQNKLLKETEFKQATNRLQDEIKVKMNNLPSPPLNYRSCDEESIDSSLSSSDNEDFLDAEDS